MNKNNRLQIIGEIPARYGSQRVKNKNLKLLHGKPLIWYAIEAAKNAKKLTDIYVNSEHDELGKIAVENGVKFYKRDPSLASDSATSDQFNYDFIKGTGADVLVMINPVAPLVEADDIDNIIDYFNTNDYDTVISVKEEYLQAFYNGKPVNFNLNAMLPRTQDLIPVQICAWAVCIWNAHMFVESYEQNGYAVFSGKIGLYPMNILKSVKISTEEDFKLAEALLIYREKNKNK
ncbi:MAG: acylneuraminate cytidylyltransferase family protein [bacterium]